MSLAAKSNYQYPIGKLRIGQVDVELRTAAAGGYGLPHLRGRDVDVVWHLLTSTDTVTYL